MVQIPTGPRRSMVQLWSAILWPSFLLAAAATAVLNATFDPATVLECVPGEPVSRLGAYSISFLAFWALGAISSLATSYYLRTDGTSTPKPLPPDTP